MGTVLVEKGKENQRVYNTVLVKPESLNVFSNGLPMKIVRELGKQPQCAMDLSRKLKEHEQNVYYHLKRLKNAGLIRLVSEENRYGMTAKIYELVSPVVAAKLHEEGYKTTNIRPSLDPKISEFLHPFIINRKLNAEIILGNPHPHGKYEEGARDGAHASDLTLFFGNFIDELKFPCVKFDTQVKLEDLKNNNLILVGNPKSNIVMQKINKHMPIYFDEESEWSLVSRSTGQKYSDIAVGAVMKVPNPFNRNKKILLFGGKRTRGTKAAILAFIRHMDELTEDQSFFARIVIGIDKDSDYEIDSVKFAE